MDFHDATQDPILEAATAGSSSILRMPYMHQPLPDDSTWIRLLELRPASDHNAPIHGSLRIALLEENLSYEALSYCWGDPSINEPMYIDGHSFAVTVNLADALRTLRFTNKARVIWIDAICINQNDVPEKNHQVGIMRDIYAGSLHTNVWLGPSDDHSQKKFKQVGKDDDGISLWNAWEEVRDTLATRPRKATVNRPWTSRIWVVQEIAASRAITVHCGRDQCSWEDFEDVWRLIGPSFVLDPRSEGLILAMNAIKREFANGGRLPLHMALQALRPFDATLAVDKVYAVVGLLHRPDDVNIDYRTDPRDLFRGVAMDVISQTGSLDILGDALQDELGPKLTGLLSWIPDWTSNSFSSNIMASKSFSGLARQRESWASNCTFSMPVLQPDHTLQVRAQFIAQVEEVGQPCPDFMQVLAEIWPQDKTLPQWSFPPLVTRLSLDTIQNWREVAFKNKDRHGFVSDNYVTGQSMVEAFYCTTFREYPPAICDQAWQLDIVIDMLEGLWKVLKWSREYILPLPSAITLVIMGPILALLSLWMTGYCYVRGVKLWQFFRELDEIFPGSNHNELSGYPVGRTDNGLLGLFPGPDLFTRHDLLTVSGDSVVLLQGASMPFVIRKAGDHWRIVGEAYIYGIMYGAAFKQDQCVDISLC